MDWHIAPEHGYPPFCATPSLLRLKAEISARESPGPIAVPGSTGQIFPVEGDGRCRGALWYFLSSSNSRQLLNLNVDQVSWGTNEHQRQAARRDVRG